MRSPGHVSATLGRTINCPDGSLVAAIDGAPGVLPAVATGSNLVSISPILFLIGGNAFDFFESQFSENGCPIGKGGIPSVLNLSAECMEVEEADPERLHIK